MPLSKYRLYKALFILAATFVSCSTAPEEPQEDRSFPEIFEEGLEAHGGLDIWNKYNTLSFKEVSGSDTTYYMVDLKNRNELITLPGRFKVGFTNESTHIFPHRDSFPGDDPKFYHNLRFYFFALPFVTADPGAHQTPLSPGMLNGKMYNRVKVTYDEGIGVAPKDQYILWYDPATDLLQYINYSVTYFDASRAEQYNAIGYEGWTDIDGLMMPSTMVGYQWGGDSLGGERYRRQFVDISFEETIQPVQTFTNLSW